MNFNLDNLIRTNIKALVAYSSARDEFKGKAEGFLDANENPFSSGFNRYPGQEIKVLQQTLTDLKGLNQNQLLLGNGSDESIDLLLRAFCEPYLNSVLCFAPTYSMYKIWAQINAVAVKEVPLLPDFDFTADLALENLEPTTKLIFVCSPNNPTGNAVKIIEIEKLCQEFNGLVIIDEAYVDFTNTSAVSLINCYPNLVVIQTLSKAWGLAGIRIGLTIASDAIIAVLYKIKPPYNISTANAQLALNKLKDTQTFKSEVSIILQQKSKLIVALKQFDFVEHIFKSDANFLLVRFKNSALVFNFLKSKSIVVRDRSKELGCDNCLRITIGTALENNALIEALKTFKG